VCAHICLNAFGVPVWSGKLHLGVQYSFKIGITKRIKPHNSQDTNTRRTLAAVSIGIFSYRRRVFGWNECGDQDHHRLDQTRAPSTQRNRQQFDFQRINQAIEILRCPLEKYLKPFIVGTFNHTGLYGYDAPHNLG